MYAIPAFGLRRSIVKPLMLQVPRGPFYTRPEEFENGAFTLITHQMFSVHTTPGIFKNAAITRQFICVVVKFDYDYRYVIVSGKLRFQNVFGHTVK